MEKDEVVVGSALIHKNDKFLLIKAKRGAAKGLWNTPGGGADPGELFEECATREAFEETGFVVRLGRLVGTFHFRALGANVVKKILEAEIIGGELNPPDSEIEMAKWFSADEMENEMEFTAGTIISVKDFISGEFEKVYHTDRVA